MLPFRRSFVCCVSNSSVSSIRWSFLWHFNIRLFYLAFNVCVQQHTRKGRRMEKNCGRRRPAWEWTQRMRIVVIFVNWLRCSTTMSMRCDKRRDVDRHKIARPRSSMKNLNSDSASATLEIIVSHVVRFPFRHVETNGNVSEGFIKFSENCSRSIVCIL